jgi:tripartite-type tricarboxylate transporter receptor subunit TctC
VNRIVFSVMVLFSTGISFAQDFPTRQVRIIVPYAPGGGADVLTRIVAEEMGRLWKQTVVIDNRPGASGILAIVELKKSRPDGHDYVLGEVGSLSVNPSLYRKLPYDPEKDLVPVTDVMLAPWVFFTAKTLPYKSMKDLIEAAKAQPGKLTYGSTGTGAPNFMAAELLKLRAGIDLLEIPFKDGNQLRTSAIQGDITLSISSYASSKSVVDKLTPLAVAARSRQPEYPHVPTVGESGGPPDLEITVWGAFMGLAGMPLNARDKFYQTAVRAMHNPEVKRKAAAAGFDLGGRTPEELAKFIKSETERYREVIAAAKVQLKD